MNLEEEIESVFKIEPPPKYPIVDPGYLNPNSQGDEGATKYFLGKSWRGLSVDSLLYHKSAMYMFTPESHKFYLPAFMVASINFQDKAGDIPDNIILHFSSYKNEFWWKRISIMSPKQCDVVIKFILKTADCFDHEDGYVNSALEGLDLAKNKFPKKR